LGKLLFCARHRIPVIYTPIPLAGGTGPVTAAGNIIQATVDSWAGLVVAQQLRPGLPFFMGAVLSVMDMNTMILAYGAPELSLMMAGLTELAHYAGLPLWQTGGCTDSKCLDEQAALEGALSSFFSALTGGDLCHDVGYTESGMTGSILQTVMMDDAIGYSRRITRGIEVNADTLAADVIQNVGPDGHYLYEDHTMRHFKTEFWYPSLCDRHNFEEWEETGGKTMRQRVIEKTREIIASHKPSVVKPETVEAIESIMKAAEERVRDKA
jgi:trimethylamine--corrinoid protein Co-methyltransferase